jgi:hypothetical protein
MMTMEVEVGGGVGTVGTVGTVYGGAVTAV